MRIPQLANRLMKNIGITLAELSGERIKDNFLSFRVNDLVYLVAFLTC
jgi:hypothetical protein